jgi:hypothetical protein
VRALHPLEQPHSPLSREVLERTEAHEEQHRQPPDEIEHGEQSEPERPAHRRQVRLESIDEGLELGRVRAAVVCEEGIAERGKDHTLPRTKDEASHRCRR